MKSTIVLKAKALARHAQRIATGTGCCVVPRALPNPTLVAHGLAKASRWHVLTHEPPRKAVADLYVLNKAEAHRVARLLATMVGEQLELLDNSATPADLRAHPRSVTTSNPKRAKVRKRANPKPRTFARLEAAHMATVREYGKLPPVAKRTPAQHRRAAILRTRLERFSDMIQHRYRGALVKNPPAGSGAAFAAGWRRAWAACLSGRSTARPGAKIAAPSLNPTKKAKRRVVKKARTRTPGAARRSRARAKTSRAAGVRKRATKQNPSGAVARAARAFRTWQDRGPIPIRTKKMRAPKPLTGAAAELGKLVAVVYRSDKYTGKETDYEHDFGTPLPSLVSDPDAKGLHIVGGRYKITADGIIN